MKTLKSLLFCLPLFCLQFLQNRYGCSSRKSFSSRIRFAGILLSLLFLHAAFFQAIVSQTGIVYAAQTDSGNQYRKRSFELQFLDGLRKRKYFDSALLYISTLESNPRISSELKAILPYEKAATLLANVRAINNPDSQASMMNDAMELLKRFTKESPNHPKAADANTQRGNIFLERAKLNLVKIENGAGRVEADQLRKQAKLEIQNAKNIFQKAHRGFESAWKAFPTSIPVVQVKKIEARSLAKQRYLQAKINLALCTYEESHTYPKRSSQAKSLLKKASDEFKAIHLRDNSTIAGIYSHLMQGKCFQEQGDIRKAIGIFNLIKDHPDNTPALLSLKQKALRFRFQCLIDESLKDYQIVIDEANLWIKNNPDRGAKGQALGLKWEKAQALELLAKQSKNSPDRKKGLYRQAQSVTREIKTYPSPYRSRARKMFGRMQVVLGEAGKQPQNFPAAYDIANELSNQISKLKMKVDSIKGDRPEDQSARTEARNEFDAHLEATRDALMRALQLAKRSTPTDQLNIVRYRLQYIYYTQKRSLEAASIGLFLVKHFGEGNDATALDAGFMGIVALSQEQFRSNRPSEKKAFAKMMIDLAQQMEKNWPESERINDIRRMLGQMLRRDRKHLEAATWFQRVPSSSKSYPLAQLDAGQAYWNTYLNGAIAAYNADVASTKATPDLTNNTPAPPTAEEMKKWLALAETSLRRGLKEQVKNLEPENGVPSEIVRAKISLAQILIRQGKDAEAVSLIADKPFSVLEAIAIDDESKRPTTVGDIQSRSFASFAYQQLLRAYVGSKNLPKAKETRLALEKVAGAEGKAALTTIYVELGRELQNELKELKQSGNHARAAEVRGAFESFLADLFATKDGQSYGSLIWIAETYFGMAQGGKDDARSSKQNFQRAMNAYNEILSRASKEAGFIDAKRIPAVQIRLATCQRNAGDFQGAEKLLGKVLEKEPSALNVQIEAASLYQQWAETGDVQKFDRAISGSQLASGAKLWGWNQIANRLKNQLRRNKKNKEFQSLHDQARLHLVECRIAKAKRLKNPDKKNLELQRAMLDINLFIRLSPRLANTEHWSKLDNLYQTSLSLQGKKVVELQVPEFISLKPTRKSPPPDKTKTPKKQALPKEKPSDPMFGQIMLGGAVLVCIIVGVLFFLKSGKPKKRKTDVVSNAESAPVFDDITMSVPKKKKRRVSQKTPGDPSSEPKAKKRPPKN